MTAVLAAPAASPAPIIPPAAPRKGHGALTLRLVEGQTRVTRSLARDPLKLLSPKPTARAASVYATTFGGGLVAGDHVHLDLDAGSGTTAFLTTQSATKVFRSVPGRTPCRQSLHAVIVDDALLVAWPDPVIAFDGARYEQCQSFDLAPTASLALVDVQSAGRLARGERWAFRRLRSQNRVAVDGRTVINDVILLDDADGPLASPFRTGRFNALATVILIGPRVRPLIDALAAAESARRQDATRTHAPLLFSTSRHADALVIRAMTEDPQCLTNHLRTTLAPLSELLGVDPWSRKW